MNKLSAQAVKSHDLIVNHQFNKSDLFADDILINDQSQQNQRMITFCSAFNGWIYAGYPYFDNSANQDAGCLLRSKDNGETWTVLNEGTVGFYNIKLTKMKLLVCGHDTSNLKVFVGYTLFNTALMYKTILIDRYDKNCIVEDEILHEQSIQIRDFDLASDDRHPASNSNPFSLALIYSKGTYYKDSIFVCSSNNGGNSFNTKNGIASSSKYLNKVSLAYGRSSSFSGGRYFAAWEELESENSAFGHIYTAHSEPGFNSQFTPAVMVDTLDSSTSNKARHPVIACQNSLEDNDNSNLTEVLLFEKYLPSTGNYKVTGLYNRQATTSNNFVNFNIGPAANTTLQPDICFNDFDSTFIITYFDTTTLKLPYYIHNFNMQNPDNWIELSAGYNDSGNLRNPCPHVMINFDKRTGMNSWIGLRGTGIGAALFDAPYIYYTGIEDEKPQQGDLHVKVFPNPSPGFTEVEFESPATESISIDLLNSIGQSMITLNYPDCSVGKHSVNLDLSRFDAGMYYVVLHAKNTVSSVKLLIHK